MRKSIRKKIVLNHQYIPTFPARNMRGKKRDFCQHHTLLLSYIHVWSYPGSELPGFISRDNTLVYRSFTKTNKIRINIIVNWRMARQFSENHSVLFFVHIYANLCTVTVSNALYNIVGNYTNILATRQKDA